MKNSERTRTSLDIEQHLEERIRRGTYAEGVQLPTVRAMAETLRVNKNTVARAYQALERKGYLELVRGRGAFVRQSAPAAGVADSRWLARLDRLLQDAKQRTVSRDTVFTEVTRRLEQVFGAPVPRVAFVECNAADIDEMGGMLGEAAGCPFDGLMLSDFLQRPRELAARYDFVVTTFYHLSEVNRALGETESQKVIGVHAMPTHDALLQVARLHAPAVALVCDRAGTVENLTHIIRTYHPTAAILPTLIDDRPRLRAVLERAAAVVVTRSCHEALLAFKPKVPVVKIVFTIDQQSVDFLKQRLAARAAAPLAA